MKLNLQLKGGATRHVLLIGKYAFKFPRLNYGWRQFLMRITRKYAGTFF